MVIKKIKIYNLEFKKILKVARMSRDRENLKSKFPTKSKIIKLKKVRQQ